MTERIVEEILTFEVYQKDGKMMIYLPIANITPTGYSLSENNLTLHLTNKSYLINNLSDRIIKNIENKNCFLIENLDQINNKIHQIIIDN